jgi:acetyltransferase-like isoleucine patch superfamily enzyme
VTQPPPAWHHLPDNPYNPHAWVIGEPEVGPGCWIGGFTVIDASGGLRIGTGCDISAGAQIYTHSTVRRAVTGRRAPIERRPTVIGDNCHIGAQAVLLMGVTLGDRCVVGAGAVVLEGTVAPDDSLLVGVPARVLPGATSALHDR